MRKTRRRLPILTMAYTNLESWIHAPRTILMLILAILLCHLEVKRIFMSLEQAEVMLYWVEMPYKQMENGVNILISTTLFLVMVSDLPRQFSYQNLMLIRSNRRQWLTAQIIYSASIVLSVILLLVVCILLFSLGGAPFGTGWSDNTRIADGSMFETEALIPSYVREHFTPGTAILYATLPLFGFWFSMSMLILLCALLGSPLIGLSLSAFALLSHNISSYELPYPIRFATVQELNPDVFGPGHYRITIAAYIVLNVLMILGMYWRIQHTDLVFNTQYKL